VADRKNFRNLRPKRSLRTILMIWFLLLSLVPLMFVTGYSLVKYEQAIDNELVQRLRANSREVLSTLTDFEKFLSARRNHHKSDPVLASYLLTGASAQTRDHVQGLVRGSAVPVTMNAFNSEGELVTSFSKEENGNAKQNTDVEGLLLKSELVDELEKKSQMTYISNGPSNSVDLVAVTRLEGKSGRRAGYIEEVINIGPSFFENEKNRLRLELIIFDGKGNIMASSHPDLLLYQKDGFAKSILQKPETYFDLPIRDEPFGVITTQAKWGDSQFFIGLAASKQKARAFVKNVNYAFFTMVGAIGILLIMTSIVATRVIVRPVYELVEAIQTMDSKDGPAEIPISTDTELGVLQESFNEMSRRIYQAKGDLENKVREVEAAYSELKSTQARLVHTAKMASLGQMVAGIAHELNNPIGFIYSNMSHLKEYSDRLVGIIETAENDPANFKKVKAEADFDYIVKDLPRLISSCEEGARRTRDIVLGLRNFSRLDESKLKRVSLKEGIENTLRLIAGELKNRIEVHEDFQPVPEVLCYASQLNQVFMNILTNAAQAIDGEGEIWITLTHLKKENKAQISIKDSGKGMAAEVVEKIFDPFFTTKSVGQGTGLGLSISYGIVKQHGGEIHVHSEPSKGTEFVISVPIDGVESNTSA
jgi:two-component system NtrC family sensor kinase